MRQRPSEAAVEAAIVERILTDGDVEAIAEATATRLAEIVSGVPGTFALVDARQLARDLGVSLDYVYAHATELGACVLAPGPRHASASISTARGRHSRTGRTTG